MAKAQSKKTKNTTKAAPPRANDAERLAAVRWLVMRIEQLSIEVFITDRDKFADVERSLRAQVKALQAMAPVRPIAAEDCPEGYVLCRDGLCAPMCDDFNTSAAPAAKSRRP